MVGRWATGLGRAWRWLTGRPAYLFMTATDARLRAEPAERFGRLWLGLLLLSLAWGGVSAGLYTAAWVIFGDYFGVPLMPVAAVVGGMGLWLYRRSFSALGDTLAEEKSGAALVSAVVTVLLALSLLGLRGWKSDYPASLPAVLTWLRPRPLYRPLLLGPLWGAWAMLIGSQVFSRGGSSFASPAVEALKSGCGPLKSSIVLAILLAWTTYYFNYLPWTQLSISAAAVGGALLSGWALARRRGGLDRQALLAVNLLTQIVFLMAYLANR